MCSKEITFVQFFHVLWPTVLLKINFYEAEKKIDVPEMFVVMCITVVISEIQKQQPTNLKPLRY